MPELPEVEALAAYVASKARGRRIERVDLVSFAALKTASPPVSALVGREIVGARRRGKFLLVETRPNGASSEDRLWLIAHFARAGWLRWHDPDPRGDEAVNPPPRRRSVGPAEGPGWASSRPAARGPVAMRVVLDDGSGFELTEMGTQKRLAVYVARSPDEVEGIARLGIEPLDPRFDVVALRELLAGRTGQLKRLISDQALIAGVGNAYSDEALHAARLSPYRPAGNLSEEEVARLHASLTGVLRDGLCRNEGVPASELKDEKRSGMRVHGRTGEPCPVCGDTIREVVFGERSFQYCPTCQTGGKPLADRRLSRLLK